MAKTNLLARFGLTEDEVPENSFANRPTPDPGTYDFTISDAKEIEGKGDNEGAVWFVITHDFGDDGEFAEFFALEGPKVDEDRLKQTLSFLKRRLAAYGQTLENIDTSEIIGSTGTLTLVKNAKGYTNIREYNIDSIGGGDADETAEEPAEEKPKAAARKPAAKPAATKKSSGNPFA